MTGRWLCCPPAVLSGRSRTRTVSLFSVTVATAIRARLLAYRPCSCLGSGTQHPLRKSAWHHHPGPNYRLSPTRAQPEDKVSRPRAPAHSPDISREKGTRDVDVHGHEHGQEGGGACTDRDSGRTASVLGDVLGDGGGRRGAHVWRINARVFRPLRLHPRASSGSGLGTSQLLLVRTEVGPGVKSWCRQF